VRGHRNIRAIDTGTVYDIPGNLRRLTRAIECGQEGRVTNLVVIFDTEGTSSEWHLKQNVIVKHFGTGDRKDAHWLVSTAKNRLEPA